MKKACTERSRSGFTLVEMLVVIAVLAIAGTLVLTIFTRSLRGNNKTQILSAIKQNGQAVLEIIDKTVRNADSVVCIYSSVPETLVVVKNGEYTRFRFIEPNNTNPGLGTCSSNNGCILQDKPVQPAPPNTESDLKLFLNNICTNPLDMPQVITDTNPQTGVSFQCVSVNGIPDCNTNHIFKGNKLSGFKEVITVKFQVDKGIQAPASLAGQIDPVTFETTIQLR